ncbi:hypothetical protein F5Y04DRAFT_41976 [Hypomontagnella monticulosa]|nr:hypothetical protein F5Y04DRAFT_41976 [Hypomontagnella monticulosa]
MDRPISATTSRVSVTGRRDYGVKFMGGLDDIPNSITKADSNTQAPAPASVPAPAPAAAAPSYEAVKSYDPPPPWDRPAEAEGDERDEEEYEGYHPFWTAWVDMFRGMCLIIGGALKIPFVIGHGTAKTFHYIPTLYNDDTVRKWPRITGFPSACAASFQVLWFGLLDGSTDWFMLPYKCARKEGFTGFFKGLGRGFASIIFKPAAGVIGFATHPFFGIYKEATKFKVEFKRERPRRDVGSLI